MLSHPSYSQLGQQQHQQQRQQEAQNEFGYLSSSLPLPEHQHHHDHQQLPSTELLTSSYDPHLFDDLCFLDPNDPSSSSSLPLNDHEDWFPFSAQQDEMAGMNMDSSFYHQSMPTIDEATMSTTSSMPPPPPLSQSFSPQSEMSMTSPQAQQQQTQQQQQQNQPINMTHSNKLVAPSYKGHRRRRSSSLPSIFYSAKKQIIQSPFAPPLFDTGVNQENTYSPIQQNIPDYQQQQHHQPPPQQQTMMGPLDTSLKATGSHRSILQQPHPPQQYSKPMPIQIQRNPVSNTRQASPITLDQQQLDKKLLKVNFNDVTVAELKDFLRERNLSVAGRKAELADRLYQERQRVEQKHSNSDTTERVPPSIATRQIPRPVTNATTSPSSPSTTNQLQLQSTPPPHIQQLTHKLGDLGFQHPPSSSVFPIYNQPQDPATNSSNNNTMPIPLPNQQHQQQQQQTAFNEASSTQQQSILDDYTQQQLDENNSMAQYYKF